MLYGPVIQKLLGIPETVSEPTAYHLLAIDPRQVTPQLVDRALAERRSHLRQNIPGPQFIPVVALIEKDLERAANILRDPAKRAAYHARLRQKTLQRRDQDLGRRIAALARESITNALNADNTLAEADRPALVARLREIGLPEVDIQTLLSRIPLPVQAVADATDEATRFLATAVDMAIDQGRLPAAEERRLMELASRLNISRADAVAIIERQLAAREATRGRADQEGPRSRFAEQVRSMHPECRATPTERARLLALARVQGLSDADAEAVFVECLNLATPAGSVAEAEEIYRIIHDQSPEQPEPRRQWLWSVIIPLVAVVLVIAAYFVVDYNTRQSEPEQAARPAALPQANASTPIEKQAEQLLAAGADPARLRQELQATDRATAIGALRRLADFLWSGSQSESARAQQLFTLLLTRPMPPHVQDMAVETLIDAVTRAPTDQSVWIPVRLLSSALFLRPSPEEPVSTQVQRERFATQCAAIWSQSRDRYAGDPLVDPHRLALASAGGGDLALVAGRASESDLERALDRLAEMAANPLGTQAPQALKELDRLANGYQAFVVPSTALRKATQLALCRVLRTTADETVADRARVSLFTCLNIGYRDTLRDIALDSREQRRYLATELEGMVRTGSRVGAHPPVAGPAAPIDQSDTSVAKIRAAWSPGTQTDRLLADVAVAALANMERASRLTGSNAPWQGEFRDVLAAPNPVGRLVAKADSAKMAIPANRPVGPGMAAEHLDRLRDELTGGTTAQRYHAIDQLRLSDTDAAAEVLLDALEKLSRGAGEAERLRTSSRILRALRGMGSSKIPGRLADMLRETASSTVAHYLVTALVDQTQGANLHAPEAWLPPAHSLADRVKCGKWWKEQVEQGRARWVGDPNAGRVVAEPPAWRPDDVSLRLLAVATAYADAVDRALRGFHWDGRVAATPDPGDLAVQVELDVDAKLLAALEAVSAQIGRLVREHPDGRKYAVRADVVEVRRKARLLACDTRLQQAAVASEAAGEMLELLVVEFDSNSTQAERIAAIRQRRSEGVAKAVNVLTELRVQLVANVELWDLLAEVRQ